MLETLISAATEAVFGYLLEQAGLSEKVRTLLRRDPQRLAFQLALTRTYATFDKQYPQWTATLFDEHFLTHGAAPLFARCLLRDNPPTDVEMVQVWADQLGVSDDTRAEQIAQGQPVAADFLTVFKQELRARAEFQALFDSHALDATAVAATQTAQSTAEMAELLRTLLELIEREQTSKSQQIDNPSPNQGAQGNFYGPVNFNRQSASGVDAVSITGDVSGSPITSGSDNTVTNVKGDQINAQRLQGFINRPSGPVNQHIYHNASPMPPTRDDILVAFASTNATLRAYEHTIAGVHIQRNEVNQIIDWLLQETSQQKIGLLLDNPGGGKTVILRDVLRHLEDMNIPVLAIKADTLGDIMQPDDLTHWLQLPLPVEACVKQLAEEGLVVVLVDQLDALSLSMARNPAALNVFAGLIERLHTIPGVRVIVSCRTFDWQSNPRLLTIASSSLQRFSLESLSVDEIARVLDSKDLAYQHLPPTQQELLRVPLHLSVFVRVVDEQALDLEKLRTLQHLYDALWEQYLHHKSIVPAKECSDVLYKLVDVMQRRQNLRLIAPVGVLDTHTPTAVNYLESINFIRREHAGLMFFHQTFFDYCYVRRFIAEGRVLTDEVFSSPQGLFERSQLLQVVAHLRETDPETYQRELRTLLFAGRLRNHLRIMLIDWLTVLPGPSSTERRLAVRLLRTPEDWGLVLDAAVRGKSTGWFDALHTEIVPPALQSNDEQRTNAAIHYLGAFIEERPTTVIAYLRPYLGQSALWDARIISCLARLKHWHDDAALALFCDFLGKDRQPRWNNIRVHSGLLETGVEHQVDLCFYHLAGSNPAAGCKAVAIYLNYWAEHGLAEQSTKVTAIGLYPLLDEKLRENGVDVLLTKAAAVSPGDMLTHLLPWFTRIAMLYCYETDDSYPRNPAIDMGWYGRELSGIGKLARQFVTILQQLATAQPTDFRALVQTLAQCQVLAVQRMLALTYVRNPEIYAQDIYDFLMSDTRRFNLGDHENPIYESCRLIGAVFPYLTGQQRAALEQHILNLWPKWEFKPILFADGFRRRNHGATQFQFLTSIPIDLLSQQAQRRRQELERKFPGFKVHEPQGIVMGWVGSPIPPAAQAHMSDNDWLEAMKSYQKESPYKEEDPFTGRAEQLADSLKAQTMADPQRFYELSQRFDDTTSLYYINALINGLAEADAPVQWLFTVVQRFGSRLTGAFRRYTSWAIAKHAQANVPDPLIAMLTAWALHDPDPGPETEIHMDDLYNTGINTNRGSATKTVCRCLLLQQPPQIERALQLLAHSAQDESPVVRVCAIESLRMALPYARERALDIFIHAVDDQPVMLQSMVVHNFLAAVCKNHFSHICSFIKAMLENNNDATRRKGAALACFAAFGNAEAWQLAEQAMQGDAAMRRGAAHVYAHNLRYQEIQAMCQDQLLRLLHDSDETVLQTIGYCFSDLPVDHFKNLRPFFKQFLKSPALPQSFGPFIVFLKRIGDEDLHLLLDGVTAILDAASAEDMPPYRVASLHGLTYLPLTAYNAPNADDAVKGRAMDIFERLLVLNGTEARQALEEWDRS